MSCYKCGSQEGSASRLCATCTRERLEGRTARPREELSKPKVYRGGARPFIVSLVCGIQFLIAGLGLLITVLMLALIGGMGTSVSSQLDTMLTTLPEGATGTTIVIIMGVAVLIHFAMWALYFLALMWMWNMRLRGLYLHSGFHGLTVCTCAISLMSGGAETKLGVSIFTLLIALILLCTPWIYKDRFA